MLQLLLGRAGTGKTAELFRAIRERVEKKEGKNYLLVPEQYSHEAERELCRVCGDTVSLYAEVVSFSRLAYNISLELGGSAVTYVDAGGRLLQLTLALEQVGGALTVYGGAARSPERLTDILSALDELSHSRITSEMLRETAEGTSPALGAKLRDLALLGEALDAIAGQTGADPRQRLEVLAQQIPRSELLRGAHILVDGFTDFTAQERQVLRELWCVSDVTVCLGCDSLSGDSEVFSLSRRTALTLLRENRADGQEPQLTVAPSWKKGTALGFLEENLFGWTEETFAAGDAVRLWEAPDPECECELAAAECLRLVRSGARYRDIAIAVRGFEDYRSAMERVFRRYGVPLYASVRTDIFTRTLPTLIASVFDILSDGWSYESMFTYLKTGLPPVSREECDELENYVLLWSIRGSAWTKPEPWHQHPEGYGGSFTDETEAQLSRLDALRRRIAAPLQHLSDRLRSGETAMRHCEALAAFWDEITLPERLQQRADALEQQGETQTAAEYRQLWDITVDALEQCAAVLGELPMRWDTFARLFKRMLSQYNVGTIPVALDRVTAGDFDRMRRRGFRHLFVLGASDDRLPRLSGGGGLFTDAERSELRENRLELPDADDALDREFNLIYNVFSLPSETVTVSRSLYTAAGSESRASFVFDRLKNLFSLSVERGDLRAARQQCASGLLELACAGDRSARECYASLDGGQRELEALLERAGDLRGRLGEAGVRDLYGDRISLTASRIDTFASCRFQYFLKYGLKAKPRQAAGFDPPELGTFLHFVLENVARAAGERGGFPVLREEEVIILTDRFVEEYVHTVLEDFREKSPRFIYLFRRLTGQVRRIVLDTAGELCRSDFRPLDFELDFSKTPDLHPIALGEGKDSLVLTGIADRVDGMERDGKLYLRVVDYKSGRKSFSLTDVWYGMGLQMLLYLFSLEQQGEARYKKKIVPAGVLYVPARDVLLSGAARMTDEEILSEKTKKLCRSGLLLSDGEILRAMEHSEKPMYLPVKLNRDGEYTGDALATAEQLSLLSRKVEDTLRDMARELRAGSIAADPWFASESENTCAMCDYRAACRFDERREGWRYKTKLKAPEFWERLNTEKGGEGSCR